jgi:phosphoribosylformylglycinamidine synthase
LSEGGLAVAAAEMAFAGNLGLEIDLARVPRAIEPETSHGDASALWDPTAPGPAQDIILLFAESNSRFLCEVEPGSADRFEAVMADCKCAAIGRVIEQPELRIRTAAGQRGPSGAESDLASPETRSATLEWVVDLPVEQLRAAWQTSPMRSAATGHES